MASSLNVVKFYSGQILSMPKSCLVTLELNLTVGIYFLKAPPFGKVPQKTFKPVLALTFISGVSAGHCGVYFKIKRAFLS